MTPVKLLSQANDPSQVVETGDFPADLESGRRCADELVTSMTLRDNALLLRNVMQSIQRSGRWGAIETGFVQRLAERLMRAAATPASGGGAARSDDTPVDEANLNLPLQFASDARH